MAQNTVVPQPPRLSGDAQADLISLNNWMWQFYQATVVESGLLDPSYQATASPTFDPNNLPDPADTSVARAQQTANAAITALLAHSLYP